MNASWILSILLQVVGIFFFFVVFFFTYVSVVERQSFKLQMDRVVDNIARDIPFYMGNTSPTASTVMLDGSLELARNKALESTTAGDDEIYKSNDEIKIRTLGTLTMVLAAAGTTLFMLYVGYGPKSIGSIKGYLTEMAVGVAVVGFVELVFLTLITAEYWSVDPVSVRSYISKAIKKYIANHPTPS